MLYRIGSMIINVISVSTQYGITPELRDYVGLRLSEAFMQGQNPYLLTDVSEMSIPLFYLYTPINPLLVACLCKVTGLSLIAGNFSINILFIFLASILLYIIVLKSAQIKSWLRLPIFVIILVASTTFFSMFGDFAFTFRSDSLGILIYCCILLLVFQRENKTLLIAFLSVFLLLTKQNMILLALPVFIYYLIQDWRRAIKYVLQCSAIMILMLVIIHFVFPLLLTESIYIQFLSVDTSSLIEAVLNIMVCIKRYFIFALICFIFGISGIYYMIKNKVNLVLITRNKDTSYIIYLILNIIVSLLSLLYFAQNGADGFKYCQEMLAIPIFLLGTIVIFKFGENMLKRINLNHSIWESALLICLVIAAFISHIQFDLVEYTKDDISQYQELYAFLDEHSAGELFIDKSGTGYFLINNTIGHEDQYFDDGHITYFMGIQQTDGILSDLFPSNKLRTMALDYREKTLAKVKNGSFEALAVSDYFSEDILSEQYVLEKELTLKNVCNGTQTIRLYIKAN